MVSCEEIEKKLFAVYKDHTPSMNIIGYWINIFKRGRTSLLKNHPGRLIRVTTENTVNKIHNIMLTDHPMKIREIANIVNISIEHVKNIHHEK